MQVMISGARGDARTVHLDGMVYPTLGAALASLRAVLGPDIVVDDGRVYGCAADAADDSSEPIVSIDDDVAATICDEISAVAPDLCDGTDGMRASVDGMLDGVLEIAPIRDLIADAIDALREARLDARREADADAADD